MPWPLASIFVAALVAGPVAPDVPTLAPAPQESVYGGVELDMGSGQRLAIDGEGNVWLDGELLVLGSVGLDPKLAHVAHRLTRDRVTVAVGIQIPHMNEPDTVVLAEIDLLHARLVWSAVLSTPTLYHDRGMSWEVIFGDDITLVQRDHVLVAVDMRTGTQAWSLAGIDATFEEHYTGSLAVERRGITIASTRVRGRDVWIDAKERDSGAAVRLQLDLATGRRVDAGAADRFSPTPLFAFSDRGHLPVRDDPPPPPPPKPADHDGVVIGATTLVWNTKTARGVIVNPTARGLGAVFDAARAQTVTATDGSTRPIVWIAVVDTATLASELIVGEVAKPGAPLAGGTIVFDYTEGVEDTGDFVDADSMAAALDIPVIRSRVDLRDLPKDLRVRQDRHSSIDVVFGAVAFHDDTHRWAEIRVSRR